jgi:tRNA nucleotidyltransferase (CCA-adding enzyme)
VDLRDVIRRITPSKGEVEKIRRVAEGTLLEISNRGYDAIWVGSSARDTFVKGERDIDLFIVFPPEVGDEEMRSKLFSIAREIFGDYQKKYAQHPYAHALYRGYEVDLVPCHPFGGGKTTPVDRTPEHHRYVSSKLNEELRGEIRLLKQFLKASGLYGAESSIHGFSGYLCELLILNYGSFEKTLEEGAKWRYGTKIGEREDMEAPLVVIDPTDPKRNVAAALSKNSFGTFLQAARRYLERPSDRFFFPQKEKREGIKEEFEKRGTEILHVHFPRPNLVDEILYPQVERFEEGLKRALGLGGFTIFRSLIEINEECEVLIEYTHPKSPLEKRQGPFLWDYENSEKFWSIYSDQDPYIEDGRWYVDLQREEDASRLIEKKLDTIAMGKNLKKMRMRVELFDPESDEELLAKLLHPPW